MNGNSVISKIKEEGNKALGEVYIEYRQEFVSWMLKTYRCDTEKAMDIYQQVIVIFYDNIRNGKLTELSSNLKTYLFAIGKNKFHESLKKEKRYVIKDDFSGEEQFDSSEEISAKKQKEIAFQQLDYSLKELGAPCNQLLKLFYYQKKSMDEITVLLNYKNRETTKNQKYKCMNRLRKIHFKVSSS